MSLHFTCAFLVLASLSAAACGTTPLSAVIAEGSRSTDAGDADTEAGGDAESCSALAEGRYVLRSRSNGDCLGQGAATTVLGTRGFLTDFDPDCLVPAQTWDLVATDVAGVFSIRSVLSSYVLDVRTGDTADGTPVITYPSSSRDNQRFEVRARDAYGYELRPRHALDSCVTASTRSAEIDACQPSESVQEWLLQRSNCL